MSLGEISATMHSDLHVLWIDQIDLIEFLSLTICIMAYKVVPNYANASLNRGGGGAFWSLNISS